MVSHKVTAKAAPEVVLAVQKYSNMLLSVTYCKSSRQV